MRLYASPRPCANGCGALLEWGLDRERRVGMVETVSREMHRCPKRVVGAYVACACGATVHRYADGGLEDVGSKLPHACTKPAATPATNRVAPATKAVAAPEPTPPKRSLNDALGVG